MNLICIILNRQRFQSSSSSQPPLLTDARTLFLDINALTKLWASNHENEYKKQKKAWRDFFLAFLKKGLSLFKQFTWCFMVLLEENYSKWHSEWVVWTHKPLLIKTAIIF